MKKEKKITLIAEYFEDGNWEEVMRYKGGINWKVAKETVKKGKMRIVKETVIREIVLAPNEN